MKHPRSDNSRRGTTIVEGVMALTIFSLAVGMGAMVVSGTQGAYGVVSSRVSAGAEVRHQTDVIADELASISRSSISPIPSGDWGSSFLFFRKIVDIQAGQPVWGARHAIYVAYAEGETDDGLDNNGDGLIDECRVVLARNVGTDDEIEVTLMRGISEYALGEVPNGEDDNGDGVIDERGLSFHLDGDVMTVRLSSVELDSHNGVVELSSKRSFRLMN